MPSCTKDNTLSEKEYVYELYAAFDQTDFGGDDSKVDYREVSQNKLRPSWEVGDKIAATDQKGNTYTLTVQSIVDGKAKLSSDKPIIDGKFYMSYQYGTTGGDFHNNTLAVSYDYQKGDKTMPAVMLSKGIIKNQSGVFHFKNAGAIVAIVNANGLEKSSKITRVSVVGENLSAGTVTVANDTITMVAVNRAKDDASTVKRGVLATVGDKGVLSSTIYIAVPAGAKIKQVCINVGDDVYSYKLAQTRTVTRNQYLFVKNSSFVKEVRQYVVVSGVKWALYNLGAGSINKIGWYVSWGNTIGYKYDQDHFVSASDDEKTKYGFTASEYDESRGNELTGDIPVSGTYDCVRAMIGGTWRLPSAAEFNSMFGKCYVKWDSEDKGYYVFDPLLPSHAGKKNSEVTGTYNKGDALLFFPASGNGWNNQLAGLGTVGNYQTSTYADASNNVHFYFNVDKGYFIPNNKGQRYIGDSVRPVSD